MKKRNALCLLIATAFVLLIGSCQKPDEAPPSIVGAWSLLTVHQQIFQNQFITHDTTFAYPEGYYSITFYQNKHFEIKSGGGYVTPGTFTISAADITLFNLSNDIVGAYTVRATGQHSLQYYRVIIPSGVPVDSKIVNTYYFTR